MLNPFSPLVLLSESGVVRAVCLITGLLAFTRSAEGTIYFFFLQEKLHYTAEDISLYYFGLRGAVGVFIQTFLIKWLVTFFETRNTRLERNSKQRLWAPEMYVLVISQVTMMAHILSHVLIVFMPGRKNLGLFLVLTDEFGNIGLAAGSGILTNHLHKDKQGAGLGTVSSVSTLCSVFGPVMFGWIYAYYMDGEGSLKYELVDIHQAGSNSTSTFVEVASPDLWAMSYPFFMLFAINLLAFFLTVYWLPMCVRKEGRERC